MRTKLMQNLGVTNKEHYGMLWYFLEWSIMCAFQVFICKLQTHRDLTMKTIFWSVSWLQQSVKND